ncbi:LysR family transcriptional regulator [Sphingosinicella soli]|uniref:DNA-binding transcriptional LysR family regulator n=1 Tax=Sphingosinicella soli TaxID=333708 RepID=A0A7W7AZK9_9SPHN|nr:LysR family transcriptional regulator [Sphingosinicella soli]MBB4631288.1 DNA-binding transcriptional LysR family regulator [Sphingosinicella soli]
MEQTSDLSDIAALVAVVETGSFSRAAERLGISKSIVSRRVARLEAALGARLLTRSAQGARPTDVGADYFARVREAITGLEAAREAVASAMAEIAGPIRLSAPLSFGLAHLAPALAEFAAAHPRVEFDISFDDRRADIIGEGLDLAVRIGQLADSTLIARKLAPIRAVAIASPAYLARMGTPSHPRDIADHDVLQYANVAPSEAWRFEIDGRGEFVKGRTRLRANSGEMLLTAVEAGLGIAMLPAFIASPAITRGSVVIVLDEWTRSETGLYAVMPPGRSATARVRALVEFLAARFGPEPTWDPCWLAMKAQTEKRLSK